MADIGSQKSIYTRMKWSNNKKKVKFLKKKLKFSGRKENIIYYSFWRSKA